MNIINATTLRNNLSDTLKSIQKEKDYLLVSKRGKLTAAIVDIDLLEDLLAANNEKYLKSIKTARKEYEKGEIYSHKEVFGEI